MDQLEKNRLFKQIAWDYNIDYNSINDIFEGTSEFAGHYTKETLFKKMLESYSWFTIIQLYNIDAIKTLLTDSMIKNLRSPSLRQKYEFVQKRLHRIVSVAR